ncbi:hypothetical protein M885DRAFT_203981 [Pelagophyceae sp. CCMP2097]|nr:hypothetical protein M885DRAFT_203981 [Pelagophyceae sp. CCMP2097]
MSCNNLCMTSWAARLGLPHQAPTDSTGSAASRAPSRGSSRSSSGSRIARARKGSRATRATRKCDAAADTLGVRARPDPILGAAGAGPRSSALQAGRAVSAAPVAAPALAPPRVASPRLRVVATTRRPLIAQVAAHGRAPPLKGEVVAIEALQCARGRRTRSVPLERAAGERGRGRARRERLCDVDEVGVRPVTLSRLHPPADDSPVTSHCPDTPQTDAPSVARTAVRSTALTLESPGFRVRHDERHSPQKGPSRRNTDAAHDRHSDGSVFPPSVQPCLLRCPRSAP